MKIEKFNKIEIRTTTDENGWRYPNFSVGIQILIDGVPYLSLEDHYLDIESFYQALPEPAAHITFVGGCHVPECCANGAMTERSSDAWYWNDREIHLRWDDVFKLAESIIALIENRSVSESAVWCASLERIDFYKSQLESSKSWVTKFKE